MYELSEIIKSLWKVAGKHQTWKHLNGPVLIGSLGCLKNVELDLMEESLTLFDYLYNLIE